MGRYKRETLENKTVAELRAICMNQGITGMSKQRKDVVVDSIMSKLGGGSPSAKSKSISKSKSTSESTKNTAVTSLDYNVHSQKEATRITSRIRVSCGASSGYFPITGKTVGAVAEFLREALNVDKMASGMVNGNSAESNYKLKDGDTLEFMKPAGKKG